MSANNLLCVICSNANRQQLGHFLWRIPLWLPRYAHTGTSPERCAQKKAHAAPGNSPALEAKARFRGNICCSALSFPSRAPDLRRSPPGRAGVLLALSTEFDFLQRSRQHAEVKNDALLQVRGWTRVGSERTGRRGAETHSRAQSWPGSQLNNDVRQCGDRASFCLKQARQTRGWREALHAMLVLKGLKCHLDLRWAASPPCSAL